MGKVARFSFKNGYKGPLPTVLLQDITLNGRPITDHLWFTVGKRFASLGLKEGDAVRFTARVDEYEKGYKGYRDDVYDAPIRTDYRLVFPTHLAKIEPTKQDGLNSFQP